MHPFCLITLTKTHPYNIKYTTTSKTKIYPIIKKSPWKAFWLSQGNYIFSFFLGHPVCQMSKNHLWVTTCQYPNYRKEKTFLIWSHPLIFLNLAFIQILPICRLEIYSEFGLKPNFCFLWPCRMNEIKLHLNIITYNLLLCIKILVEA